MLGSRSRSLSERFPELSKLRQVQIGHGPKNHAALGPVQEVVALLKLMLGQGCLSRAGGGSRPDEHIDDVFPTPKHERRDDATGRVIKPSADEGETRARQI